MKPEKTWLYNATVLISGASDGIGKLLSVRLVREFSCTVIGVARNEKKLSALKTELSDNFTYLVGDVSESSTWDKLADLLRSRGEKLTLIVNNAGVMPPFVRLKNMDEAAFSYTLSVNLTAAFLSVKKLLPYLERHGGIVNISSSAALCPLAGTAAYSASKAALKAMTVSLAAEEKDKYVAYVCPGFTKTNLFRDSNDFFGEKLIATVSASVQSMTNKILRGIIKKKRRMVYGLDAKAMRAFHSVAPTLSASVIAEIMELFGLEAYKGMFDD